MSLLHIHNGDAAADTARQSALPGEHFAFRESLVTGPTPAGLSVNEWRRIRAQHLVASYGVDEAECERSLERQAALLGSAANAHEVVLWFEHDLFCQVHLLYLLDWFARNPPAGTRLSLICINEFPGREHFRGLGELNPEELASLFPLRTEVNQAQMSLARAAWRAFCAPDPSELVGICEQDVRPLPFLQAALRAHLARFPSLRNGLGQVENRALNLVAEGRTEFAEIFTEFGAADAIYGFGDAQFWLVLRRLITARTPLLNISGPQTGAELPHALTRQISESARFAVTDLGQSVRTGATDFTDVDGSDLWLGGVHRDGRNRLWRWQEASQTVVLT